MKTLQPEYLLDLWRDQAPDALIQIADSEYAVPLKSWLLTMAMIVADGNGEWKPAFDCDDFAFALKLATQRRHSDSNYNVSGLAVGVLFYVIDGEGPHAINWSIDRNGDLWFIEPQRGKEVCLSDSELQSVFFVYA